MKKRILRKGAIVALALVLMFNTLGVSASTAGDEERIPDITVSNYEELVRAFTEQRSGSLIGVTGTIEISPKTEIGRSGKYFDIIRMDSEAQLIFTKGGTAQDISTVENITFDGNAGGKKGIGGTKPFIVINHAVKFDLCTFSDFLNQGGNGGVIYIASGNTTLESCTFSGNSAGNGSHIYATGSGILRLTSCEFTNGWADEKGGALYLDCSSYLNKCTVKGNHARIGGGIYSENFLDITETLVYKNEVVIQGADIVNEGYYGMNIRDTKEVYDRLLEKEGLYFTEWIEDIDTSVGGAGQYLKFGVTDEAPVPPTEPESKDPQEPDPSDPEDKDTSSGEGDSGSEGGTPPATQEPTPPEGSTESGGDHGDTEKSPDEGAGSDKGDGKGEATDTPSEAPPSDIEKDPPAETESPQEPSEGGNKQDEPSSTPNDAEKQDEPSEPSTGDPASSEPSNEDPSLGGSTDNSVTDNSSQDNSYEDNSSHDESNTDNSNTDNSRSIEDRSTHDNGSYNSTTHTEDNSYKDNSSTTNYYYGSEGGGEAQGVQIIEIPQYIPVDGSEGSQPVSVSVPVTVNIPEGYNNPTGVTGAPEPSQEAQGYQAVAQAPAQNIRIEAEGVNVTYEYTAEGVSINITAPNATEAETVEDPLIPLSYSTGTAQEPERAAQGSSWVDIVSMVLLAILVLGELKDKLRKAK